MATEEASSSTTWLRLLSFTNRMPYPKSTDRLYTARLCNAAEKHKDALSNLVCHFRQDRDNENLAQLQAQQDKKITKMSIDLSEVELLSDLVRRICKHDRHSIL